MKLIIWGAEDEVAFKVEVEVITAEEADVAVEKDFMADVEKEADISEESGKTQDINGPDPMPEWYSISMARR